MATPQGDESAKGGATHDLTGTTVGRFEIRARLGAGGMGEVYRAEDTTLKRHVAIKRVIPSSGGGADYRHRILREAERASRLSDRRIAQIYDVIEERSEIFLVMEFVEGETLRQRLRRPMNLDEFLGVGIECAQALRSAHERNIIHCDVKPENIMLTSSGDVKVLDFGVAKEIVTGEARTMSLSGTQEGILRGTPAYMAPEVLLESEPDARSDIFSLGVIFYEALSGLHPFRAPTLLGTTDNILHATPPALEETNAYIPEPLSRIVAHMLAKDPRARYASAEKLLEDLTVVRGTLTPFALPSPRPVGVPPRLDYRRKLLVGAACALVIILTVAAFLLWRIVPGSHRTPKELPKNVQLAVLPFVAVEGDPQTTAFARGLVENLTAKLTQLSPGRQLQIVPAGDLLAQRVSTSEQARKVFAVDLVLEGSLQRSGDQVRITYDLADPVTHRLVRADTLTADFTDSFRIEDSVVVGAARMLGLSVEGPNQQSVKDHGTQVASAFTEYLQGLGYLQEYPKKGNVDQAIAAFEAALRLDAAFAPAHAGLGEAYWRKYEQTKDSDWTGRARQACQQAVTLNASLAESHLCLGVIDNGTGQFDKAAREFQSAIASNPNSEEAYHGLAVAYRGLGKPAETEQTFQKAILLRPNYWAPYNWLGDFYANTGEYAKAATMFEKVTHLAPENQIGYSNLGAMDYRVHRWAEAERMFKKSIELSPTALGYSNLGTLYFYQGRYAESARQFEESVQLAPKDQSWWANLGDAYRWAPGEQGKAAAAYDMAISLAHNELKINPRNPDTLATMALCQAKLGQKSDAATSIRRAVQLDPENPQYLYLEALVFHLGGDRASALDFLRKAVAKGYPVSEIVAEPEWRNLADDSEFKNILGGPGKKEN